MAGDPGQPEPPNVLRETMVRNHIMARGIKDPQVLEAMRSVEREKFVPAALQDAAYDDRALPVGEDQTISQPYIVAYMTEALDVHPTHRVLEIGTGTGYQTAILSALGAVVYSVERIEKLHEAAKQRLARCRYTGIHLLCGDGTLGWPEHAPYDRILVTAGAPAPPEALIQQLVPSGILIIPIGARGHQVLVRITRRAGRVVESPLLACRFVQLVGEQGWGNRGRS
jgi:protein-L-isoaspartate(D-aspartate) O-methyltransferase